MRSLASSTPRLITRRASPICSRESSTRHGRVSARSSSNSKPILLPALAVASEVSVAAVSHIVMSVSVVEVPIGTVTTGTATTGTATISTGTTGTGTTGIVTTTGLATTLTDESVMSTVGVIGIAAQIETIASDASAAHSATVPLLHVMSYAPLLARPQASGWGAGRRGPFKPAARFGARTSARIPASKPASRPVGAVFRDGSFLTCSTSSAEVS